MSNVSIAIIRFVIYKRLPFIFTGIKSIGDGLFAKEIARRDNLSILRSETRCICITHKMKHLAYVTKLLTEQAN